ncbi:MAG: hypothetical protein WBE83_08695 [Candidatus Cybelea sp.]
MTRFVLAIAFLALIAARPHVATVWQERTTTNSPRVNAPPAVRDVNPPFASFARCAHHAKEATESEVVLERQRSETPAARTSYDCHPRTTLLWGW